MSDAPKDEWYSTTDRERFDCGPYDSVEAAVLDAASTLHLKPGAKYYVGKRGPAPAYSISADSVLADLREEIAGEIGSDYANEAFDATGQQEDELGEELNQVLTKWVERHGLHLRCWTITDEQTFVYQPVGVDVEEVGG